jgi:hypothetical protein
VQRRGAVGREGAADLEAGRPDRSKQRRIKGNNMQKYIFLVAIATIIAAVLNMVTEHPAANLAMVIGLGAQVVMWSIVANNRRRG